MKKLIYLFIAIVFTANTSFAQQLTFKLANPRIIHTGGTGTSAQDNFEIDLLVMASAGGSYYYTGQWQLSFANTSLSTNVNDWFFDLPSLTFGSLAGRNGTKYSVASSNIETVGSVLEIYFSIVGNDTNYKTYGLNGSLGHGPTDDWIEVTTSYQTLCTITSKITASTGIAGIDFDETISNGQQQFVSGASLATAYINPCLFDAANFNTTYLGRLYSSVKGWSQVGNTADAQWVDWTTAVNTSIWDGTPILTGGSELKASNLRIHNPAILTIPFNGALTVAGETDIVTPRGGLIIQSGSGGTGSLITNTATDPGSGSTVAQCYLTTGAWHLVSSPVVETVNSFLTLNSKVPTNASARGMMDYNPSSNTWNAFFTNGIGGNVGGGKGFCLRSSSSDTVSFRGALQAGNQSATGLGATYWNCVGNPYSSAIGINSASTSGATNNFLTVNTSNLDPSYGAVYIWQQPDASNGQTGKYTAVSNLNGALDVQQGQAYMVKMNSGITSLSFTPAMQFHSPSLTLKAAENVWPTIKLIATADPQTNYTTIAFNSGMTKGLDPTYDAGLLKGGTDLLIYTKLVEDNGIPFAIQALPDNNFDKMIIPVGLDFKTGGDVVFSAETTNLPGDCKVILEDIPAAVFTDLSNAVYKVTIPANSVITDRFRLHTSLVSSVIDPVLESTLNAYAFMNIEIRIVGEVSSNAVATLYQVDGKAMIIQKLAEGSLNVIPISSFNTGLYILTVRDGVKLHTFKIPLKR